VLLKTASLVYIRAGANDLAYFSEEPRINVKKDFEH
jgi:hypothetical protein